MERPPYTILIAESHQHADYWCRHVSDPPVNPRDRYLTIITNTERIHKLRGMRLIKDYDQVIYYTWPTGKGNWFFGDELAHTLRIIFKGNDVPKTY